MNRNTIAQLISGRLEQVKEVEASAYAASSPRIGHFVVDDLLPKDLAHEIAKAFPEKEAMVAKEKPARAQGHYGENE